MTSKTDVTGPIMMACLQSKFDVCESLPLLCLSSVTGFDISIINALLSGSRIVVEGSALCGDCAQAIRSQGNSLKRTS